MSQILCLDKGAIAESFTLSQFVLGIDRPYIRMWKYVQSENAASFRHDKEGCTLERQLLLVPHCFAFCLIKMQTVTLPLAILVHSESTEDR